MPQKLDLRRIILGVSWKWIYIWLESINRTWALVSLYSNSRPSSPFCSSGTRPMRSAELPFMRRRCIIQFQELMLIIFCHTGFNRDNQVKVKSSSKQIIMMSLCTGSSSSTQWQNIEGKTWKRAYGALVKEAADKVKTTKGWKENSFEIILFVIWPAAEKLHCGISFTPSWVEMSCLGCTRCFLSKVRGSKRWKK